MSETVSYEATLSLQVTDLAKAKLQQFLGDRPLDEVAVRVGVLPGGCSGAQYNLGFAEALEEGEIEFRFNDVRVFVNPLHAPLLNGCTVDFVDELMGGGFKIENPNATSQCGCGKSFSA
ncbi:MAG: HesB/IscA family protein [Thermoplasmatota archaeon]